MVHIGPLKGILKPEQGQVGDALYHLMQVGLVEHLGDSTYRIPRALARKLNLYVAGALPRSKSMSLLKRFAQNVSFDTDDSGGVALTNKIQIRLATGSSIPEEDLVFVTASMLFKAGWQRYRLGQYSAALALLRRAFHVIDRVQDDSARLEVVRFYGLAAARERMDKDVRAACGYLGKPAGFHHQFREKAKAMRLFIQAFSYKCKAQFKTALPIYEDALKTLPEGGFNDGQRSQMLNEAVQCILRTEPVDYKRALEMAELSCSIRETPNTIDVLLRALLAQTYSDESISIKDRDRNISAMERWESRLKEKSEAGRFSFYARRLIDRLEAEAINEVFASHKPYPALDLSRVISICDTAYFDFDEDALLWRKWDLMLLDEKSRDWESLHSEAEKYLATGGPNKMGRGNAARIFILTFNMSDEQERRLAFAELDKYRGDGTLPKAVAADIRRQLGEGDLSQCRVIGRLTKRGPRLQWDD